MMMQICASPTTIWSIFKAPGLGVLTGVPRTPKTPAFMREQFAKLAISEVFFIPKNKFAQALATPILQLPIGCRWESMRGAHRR